MPRTVKVPPRVNPLSISGVEKNLDVLAEQIKVSVYSLKALEVVWSDEYKAWLFPMRNGKNEIIGWNRRFENGEKRIVAGTNGGLYIPQIEPIYDLLFVVEGGSDTAAMLDMGLLAIGRFNVNSGAEYIKEYARINGAKRIVIVADNDELKQRPNGDTWRPGLDGARKLEKEIGSKAISIVVPNPYKDVRQMLNVLGARAARNMICDTALNKL